MISDHVSAQFWSPDIPLSVDSTTDGLGQPGQLRVG